MNAGIIWDWDGTLADTADISKYFVNEVRRHMGQEILDDVEYERQARGPFDYWDCYGEKRQEALTLFHDLYRDGVTNVILFDAVENLVKWIYEFGIPQFIISNKREDTLLCEVSKSTLGSYFKNIVGVQDKDMIQKPHPKMLDKALNGVSLQKIIMIGDSATDMQFAKNIGALSVFVDSPFLAGTRDMQPQYSFKTHEQMGRWLKSYLENENS